MIKIWILDRLHEASTYRAIFRLAAAFSIIEFSGEQEDAIIALAFALTGGAGLLPDKLRKLPFVDYTNYVPGHSRKNKT